ncbi:CCA tRNA nucleotidyltransferase [Chelatococcus sp. GCM10030263]|uniref:CCA tRNA nucleotidyltransferase n=1 Tax=Chelatococcus sp. GCM10030263 TaxID=3273387 RepID=UPI00360FFFF6
MTPEAASAALLARSSLRRLLDALDGGGEETRVVGGAVRNALLDRPVNDVDCATTMPPAEVIRRAKAAGLKSVPTGLNHGTVTVIVEGTPYEVTTLREDVATDGRHATVAFARDFAADARRRDFTMNALYLSRDGRIHDFVGGLTDIAARRLRFIGDPDQRIREDYLRILRFFRFHADYAEGPLDREGFAATIRQRAGLDGLSRERIRAELMKLLVARRAAETLAAMAEAGHLTRILAGVGELGRLDRVAACEKAAGGVCDAVLRLGALAVSTSEDAARLKERLRLSNEEHTRLTAFADLAAHLRGLPERLDGRDVRRLAVIRGLQPLTDAFAVLAGEPRPELTEGGRDQLGAYRAGAAPPVFPLSGRDALALGIDKGPAVGRILARARALWLDADCPSGREAALPFLRQAAYETSAESSQD